MSRRARVQVEAFDETPAGFRLRGTHTGYDRLPGSPRHERTFDVLPGRVTVEDRVTGGQGQVVEARILLHPNSSVQIESGVVYVTCGAVHLVLETEADVRLEPGMWYPDFGVEIECWQIVMDYGNAPVAGGFVIVREGSSEEESVPEVQMTYIRD